MYDVAIMQPAYLPWAGYFHLMTQVKHFIFLDDVEFSKASWQSRNRINHFGEVQWISLPVRHVNKQKINEVAVRYDARWPKKHIQQLQSVYGKAPFFADLKPVLECIKGMDVNSLSEVNVRIIRELAQLLEVECAFHLSSAIEAPNERSERLLGLITAFRGTSYFSPQGSKEYLESDGVLSEANISVVYQDYSPCKYLQYKSDQWHSSMSIVDVIANIGLKATKKYIRSH